jgi:hypothetical protein
MQFKNWSADILVILVRTLGQAPTKRTGMSALQPKVRAGPSDLPEILFRGSSGGGANRHDSGRLPESYEFGTASPSNDQRAGN